MTAVMVAVRLTVVGSSDAFNAAGRRHSCYLLQCDEPAATVMIDFGPTALQGLHALGRQARDVDALVFTHLHGDHIGGYPFLYIDGLFNDVRDKPLDVVGPSGTAERLDSLLRVCYGDLADRERPYALNVRELLPGERLDVAGMVVEGFAAEHMDPPERPLCLRVTTASGRRLAFSGDTMICDGLRDAARGADLLVAECSALAPPCGRHISWSEWREAHAAMACRRLLLSHLGGPVRAGTAQLLAELPAGHVVGFADDGMVIEL